MKTSTQITRTRNPRKTAAKTQNERNIKYKRKKNIFKKCKEFSEISGQDVIIFFYDRQIHKLDEFYTSDKFKIKHVQKMINDYHTKVDKKLRYAQVNQPTISISERA